jgi:hypothetical protein
MHNRLSTVLAVIIFSACFARASEYQPKITVDREQYEYSDSITVNLALRGLDKTREYTLFAVDTYNRIWYLEKFTDASTNKTITLQVPPLKGLSLVLERPGKSDKEGAVCQLAVCPVILNVRGANIHRPSNFVNMIYGGGDDTKQAHRLMRSIGLNGGMAYMWQTGSKLAVDDLDYYHEYMSSEKRSIQDTEFDKRRNNFIHDVNVRGLLIREDVLGHGEWIKKAAALFDTKHEFDAAFAKYTAEVAKLREDGQAHRDSPTPWAIKGNGFNRVGFLAFRPQLALLRPETRFLFQRPFNWFDPDETILVTTAYQSNALKDRSHQALGYSLGDEISNTFFSSPFDYDYSEVTLGQFREWLKKEYPSLSALNAEWGTQYAQWADVVPYTIDETRILNMPEYKKRMLQMLQDHNRFSIPWPQRTVPEKRNYASWSDWRTFQDTAWADKLSEMSRGIRKLDTTTPIGILGAQAPSAFGGFDYDKLIHSEMNWIEAYDICCSKEILRSFNKCLPEEKRWCISRTHFPGGEAGKYSFWWYLFMRDQNNVIWQLYSPSDGFFTDEKSLQMTEKAATLRKTMLEVTDGIGKAFIESQEPFFPIAIYLSQRSVQAHWMIDSESDGSTWIQRFSSFESQNNSQNNDNMSWTKLLEDLGYQYDFVGQSGLLAGDLQKHGCRVLILPKTVALSDEEAAAISRFVAGGGTVIADTMTGVLDGHCKARASFKGALDDLFGIQRTSFALTEGYKDDVPSAPYFIFEGVNAEPLVFNDSASPLAKSYAPQKNFYAPEPGLKEAGAKALAAQGKQPAFFLREQGAGRTLYMGASLLRYVEDRLNPGQTVAIRTVVGNLLRDVIRVEPSGIGSVDGRRLDSLRFRSYSFGDNAWLYGINQNVRINQDELGNVSIHGLANTDPIEMDIDLATTGYMYDLRQGKYLGKGHTARVRMLPTEGLAISVLPYKVDGVELKAEPVELTNGMLRVNLTARIKGAGDKAARHLLRFQTFSPKDVRVRYSTALATCDATGVAHATVLLSPNDLAGRWTFSALDIHTGLSSSDVKVEKENAVWRDLQIQDDPYSKGSLVNATPEAEASQKAGVFMSMRTPMVVVEQNTLQAKVQVVLYPETDEAPDGTLTVFDQLAPDNKQTFKLHDVLKGGNGAVNVTLSRPVGKARDMDLHAVLEYTGSKREDHREVKVGVGAFGTPKFDGTLDDSLWSKASVLGGFRAFDSGAVSMSPAKAKVLFDDQYVYIGLDVDVGDAKNLVSAEVARDGNWFDAHLDTVEILIGKTHASTPKYNLGLSWNGVQSEKVFDNPAGYGGIPWSAATKKTDHGWTGVARVPLAALRCGAPGNGDVWLFNFTHNAFVPGSEISQYSVQGRDDFNLPKFGQVVMLGNSKPAVGKMEMPHELPVVELSLDAKVDLDGKLDESCWKKAAPLGFRYLEGLLIEPEDPTVARLAADKDNLYFSFEASERFMKDLVIKAKSNNDPAIWDNDMVEVFIDPDGKGDANTYLHAVIGASGLVSTSIAKNMPGSWQPKIEVKVVQGDKGWIVEGKLPFASFNFTPEPGKTLHVNLARTKPGKGKSFWEETSWSPTFDSSSHVPERFGIVKFK